MIVTLVLAVALPVGAYAVSGTSVFITDHSSGSHAAVSASGALQTAAQPTIGGVSLFADAIGPGNACAFFTPPAGKAFVVTAIDLIPLGASPATVEVEIDVFSSSALSCGGSTHNLAFGRFGSDNPQLIPLSPGIGVAHGHYLNLTVVSASRLGYAKVYGYYVPSAACSAAANCV
jgi:hypothetical protein